MYSVVLLMALSGGAETPAADCAGCYGGGCYGGYGCNGGGCHGGGLFSHGCRGGGLFSHGCRGGGLFSHGCHGGSGCNGGGCHGGYGCNGGGCHGGGLFHRGGHGCHGCNGGCYGGYGCNGGCHGAAVGCAGGAGCAGCEGAPAPAPAPMPAPAPDKKKTKSGEEANLSAPATVIVSLPAEATLKVDDYLTTSKSATRLFVTPALTRGQEFSYTLTGEIVRDGKPVVATKQVTVRAGEETRVAIEFPETVAAK